VRAGRGVAEQLHQRNLDGFTDDVLPSARFVMSFSPRQMQHIGEETLCQPVATHDALTDGPARLGEADATGFDFDEPLGVEPFDHLADRRPADVEPFDDAGLDHVDVVFA